MGNADLILVHSKASEETFVNGGFARTVDGFSAERISFMYNFFVLVGPKADPANVEQCASIKDVFATIADSRIGFISRGDKSGTHNAEIKLWDTSLGITNDVSKLPDDIKDWYISAGQGMGACLTMAAEKQMYILSDKATFLTYKKNLGK
jgi:ABC-type tungstate transport system permease subunit